MHIRASWAAVLAGVLLAGAARADELASAAALLASNKDADGGILARNLAGNSELMTTEGSANDIVWSAFEQLGWMTVRLAPQGGPTGLRMKAYRVTAEGKVKLRCSARASL